MAPRSRTGELKTLLDFVVVIVLAARVAERRLVDHALMEEPRERLLEIDQADVVQRADVRIAQRGNRARLALEPGQVVLLCSIRQQELDGRRAAKHRV